MTLHVCSTENIIVTAQQVILLFLNIRQLSQKAVRLSKMDLTYNRHCFSMA